MAHRRPPKEAIREGQRARLGGLARSSNPYDRPFALTDKNGPEFKAAARLRAAWLLGWDAAEAQLQADAGTGDPSQAES